MRIKLIAASISLALIGVGGQKASALSAADLTILPTTKTTNQISIANPIKFLEEQERIRVEEEKRKAEEERRKAEEARIAHLRATQPWVLRPDGGPNLFYTGQCTRYAKDRRPDVNWRGNANVWDERARGNGFSVSVSPSVGTIAVFQRYMHVAIVEAVDGSKALVSEMNYRGRGVVSQRWININEAVYIF